MNDTPRDTVSEYISAVKRRFSAVLELATFLPSSTPNFWGDDVIKRLSNADREKLESYLSEAKRLREHISVCDETIQARMGDCIDHVEKIEASAETPADAPELFLRTYGLFDEALRLSALAMQSIHISEKIAHLLESASDAETNAAARQRMEAEIADLKKFVFEGFAAAAQDRKEQTREILDKIDQKEKAAARQPTLTQKDAAKAILRAEGVKTPTETQINSTKRKIRSWEAFTEGKGGHRPPGGYPGLRVSANDFSQWAMRVQRDKDSVRALRNICTTQRDFGKADEQTTRRELVELAGSAPIDQVKNALEAFDS